MSEFANVLQRTPLLNETLQDRSQEEAAFADLAMYGLNLHAVFAVASLSAQVLDTLGLTDDERLQFRQVILIGHQGRDFWAALQRRGMHGAHPVDQFVTERVDAWMKGPLQGPAWRQVFPGSDLVGLQSLGALAGWHHSSPFWVGVDAEWGSWFAYRAVVLADTDLALTARREATSPCATCADQPCIKACPAGALNSEPTQGGDLQRCLNFRKHPDSRCQDRCLARNACPVGAAHRYADSQTTYHYLHSLQVIRKHY
jgi:epoxyqueuosine reductase